MTLLQQQGILHLPVGRFRHLQGLDIERKGSLVCKENPFVVPADGSPAFVYINSKIARKEGFHILLSQQFSLGIEKIEHPTIGKESHLVIHTLPRYHLAFHLDLSLIS